MIACVIQYSGIAGPLASDGWGSLLRIPCGSRCSARSTTGHRSKAVLSRSIGISALRRGKMPARMWQRHSYWCCRMAPSPATTPLSSTAVNVGEWPAQAVSKLPLIPATLLGRLAVDRRHQGNGYGRFLLGDALLRAVRSEIASFAVIVDAKENARRFYERESFLPFPDQPLRLLRPMADIAELFK